MKTLKQLAEEALAIQDACNLSGCVHAFSRAMTDLRANLPNAGTDEINTHPIAVMYASKIESLTGCSNGVSFSQAYDKTYIIANT
jgi:hypothetical protein